MKKKLAWLLIASMAVASVAGCGAKKVKIDPENDSEVAFEGKYMVDTAYVKENLDDIVLIDARGEEAAKKERLKVQCQLHGSILQHVKMVRQVMQIGDVFLTQSV